MQQIISNGDLALAGERSLQDARELPRFPPGFRVECLYEGRFCKGTVVGNYYREPDFEPDYFAPYQVQLDDADGGDLIWMPQDDDEYVRAVASECVSRSSIRAGKGS